MNSLSSLTSTSTCSLTDVDRFNPEKLILTGNKEWSLFTITAVFIFAVEKIAIFNNLTWKIAYRFVKVAQLYQDFVQNLCNRVFAEF